jgi:hypothetical protein
MPALRPDPTQRPRLEELIEALGDRKVEAEQRGWLGELEGIEISLNAAREKLSHNAVVICLARRRCDVICSMLKHGTLNEEKPAQAA